MVLIKALEPAGRREWTIAAGCSRGLLCLRHPQYTNATNGQLEELGGLIAELKKDTCWHQHGSRGAHPRAPLHRASTTPSCSYSNVHLQLALVPLLVPRHKMLPLATPLHRSHQCLYFQTICKPHRPPRRTAVRRCKLPNRHDVSRNSASNHLLQRLVPCTSWLHKGDVT